MNSGIAASATLGTLLVTLASMVFVPLDPELGLRIALVIVVAASLGYAARERARVPSAVVIAIDREVVRMRGAQATAVTNERRRVGASRAESASVRPSSPP